MQTSPAAYGESMARQAREARDEFLVHLLIYATRAVLAGSPASEISAAETAAVAAEMRRRGLAFPFWFNEQQEAA